MVNRKRKIVMLMIVGSEPERVQARLISSCLALAEYISADLEIFVPNIRFWPHERMFSRFKYGPHFRISVTAMGSEASMIDEVKVEIQDKDPVLFVLDRNHLVQKHGRQDKLLHSRVLSAVSVPTLLMMCHRNELKIPFLSLFVPMSGEVESSPALEWSINFANAMHLPVDLFHVTHQQMGVTYDPSLIGEMCDQFYHEYPHLISEFVARGSPYSSMHEKKVIRHFIHCTGLELDEIVKGGRKQARPLVVVEWKGNLKRGHARVLKGILAQTDWPILLTRQKKDVGPQLKMVRHG
jgi:hypothetical protein